MGKTAALRITRDERKAFFRRKAARVTGEDIAGRKAPRVPPRDPPDRIGHEAGFSPLGKALDRGAL